VLLLIAARLSGPAGKGSVCRCSYRDSAKTDARCPAHSVAVKAYLIPWAIPVLVASGRSAITFSRIGPEQRESGRFYRPQRLLFTASLVLGAVKISAGHQDWFSVSQKECLITLDVLSDQPTFCRCWWLGGSTIPVFAICASSIPHCLPPYAYDDDTTRRIFTPRAGYGRLCG
jgi:hypothetical protein